MSARIHYAGREYVVPNLDMTELCEQIDQGVRSREPYWLAVRFGEGRSSDAMLLISPGAMIAVIANEELAEALDEPFDGETAAHYLYDTGTLAAASGD